MQQYSKRAHYSRGARAMPNLGKLGFTPGFRHEPFGMRNETLKVPPFDAALNSASVKMSFTTCLACFRNPDLPVPWNLTEITLKSRPKWHPLSTPPPFNNGVASARVHHRHDRLDPSRCSRALDLRRILPARR